MNGETIDFEWGFVALKLTLLYNLPFRHVTKFDILKVLIENPFRIPKRVNCLAPDQMQFEGCSAANFHFRKTHKNTEDTLVISEKRVGTWSRESEKFSTHIGLKMQLYKKC